MYVFVFFCVHYISGRMGKAVTGPSYAMLTRLLHRLLTGDFFRLTIDTI